MKGRRDDYVHPDELAFARTIFDDISDFSRDTEGVSRPALSGKETQTLRYLEDRARELELSTEYDPAGNLLVAFNGELDADRYVLMGSHVDSVPMGGNFDGLAGVVAGLVCLYRARQRGQPFPVPVKVIAMRAEESAWFGPCYIASKCLTGTLSKAELASTHRGDGRPLRDHLCDVGADMERIEAGAPLLDVNSVLGYLELHIEQGPLLIGRDMPAAVVSGIRGNIRHKAARCVGEAGHSGAVPRAFRRDPVLGLADLLHRLDESWSAILQEGGDLVLTSGVVHTDGRTNAMSRIADAVEFSLDIRSQDAETLSGMRDLVWREVTEIAGERGVEFRLGDEAYTAPAILDRPMADGLLAAMGEIGLQDMEMPSGGGHDAAVFANAGIPSGMVFVRNRNGSHNPKEAMDLPDFLVGASILDTYLMNRTGQ